MRFCFSLVIHAFVLSLLCSCGKMEVSEVPSPMPAATPVVAPVETVTPDPIQKIFLENRKERGKLRLPTVINAEDRFTDPSEIPAAILKFIEQIPDVHEDCKVSVQS